MAAANQFTWYTASRVPEVRGTQEPGHDNSWGGMTIRSKARTRGHLTSFLLLLLLFSISSLFLVADGAQAEPAEITQAKQEAEQLRQLIESTAAEQEQAIEAYNEASAKLAATENALEENTALLEQAERDLQTASERLASRVEGIYKEGRVSVLEALFSAESISDFMNRLNLLMRVGRSDEQVLEEVAAYRSKVEATKEQLAQQKKDQAALVEETKAAKAAVDAKLAERQALLEGKEEEIAELERQEAERQAQLAEQAREAARLAAERAAAARAYQRPVASSSSDSSGGSAGYGAETPSVNLPASGIGAQVVQIAMQYIGAPYVWAGESPSGFDCSGLVTYVFRQVGISLPHYAAGQFRCGEPVARADLQPGDLVFFGSSIHHVGIYVGDGNMIHAPYTGASVRINSMDRSDYAGARRVYN